MLEVRTMNFVRELRAAFASSAELYRQRTEAQQADLVHNEQFKNAVETVALFRNRVRSRADARRRNKIRKEALISVRHTLQQATNMNAHNIQTIFNVALYLLQLDQDLAYFTTDMVCAIGDRRRAFVAKHEALLLYEAAKDIPELLGKKFRDAITALSVPADQVEVINAVSSDLNRFWRTHREFLGTIRNVLTAHREHDALAYAQALDSIGPLEVMHRAAELSQLLEILVCQLIGIGRLTSSPGTILRDIVRSNGASAKQKRNAA
jgi:hypothetical protein